MSLILVINAKSGLSLAIKTALQCAGYSVVLAAHAEEALNRLEGQQPQLILLGDTPQAIFHQTDILKNDSQTSGAPIVLQSDNHILFSLMYRQRLGVQAVMNNLSSSSELVQRVQAWTIPAV